ncbi:hypothetical protein WA158_007244 [Blastocystis sp. Blastoise]
MNPQNCSALMATSAAPEHNARYYGLCCIGGILACGTTHTSITPLDLVKCTMQTNPGKYSSLLDGLKKSVKTGINRNGIYKGWQPTFIGYSIQGCFKFGFYEIFKDLYTKLAGEERAKHYKNTLYLSASASAEFFADMGLCPMETVKVRIQTSPAEVNYPTKLGPALKGITSTEGFGGLYKGLVPLWCRQIPYTMVKFALFENVVALFYKYAFTKPRESYSKATQLCVTFMSGYIAGIFCAIVSHPADSVMSKLCTTEGGKIGPIIKELGWKGMWNGLATRILMIGTLTGLQWWIYDTWKVFCGFGSSGGH